MKTIGIFSLVVLAASLISGCAAPSKIANFAAPKTVAIQDFPDMIPAANIGIVITNWPAPYFSNQMDQYFAQPGTAPAIALTGNYSEQASQIVTNQITTSPRPVSIGNAAAMGAVGGAIGALIQASAEDTQRKAVEFPNLIRKSLSNADFRADLLKALRESLEARGIAMQMMADGRNLPPRLRWPGKDANGDVIATGPLANSPAVDADLLVQLSPIAIFASPGPLNNYSPKIGIGAAIFNGRTREFLGWQAIPFKSNEYIAYARYDSLVSDVEKLAPVLHKGLLSLVPRVADVISGNATID